MFSAANVTVKEEKKDAREQERSKKNPTTKNANPERNPKKQTHVG